MSEDPATLRAMAGEEAFSALRLVSALRMALNFRAILLAAIAVAGTSAGWRVCGELFKSTDNPQLQAQIAANSVWPWERPAVGVPVGHLTTLDAWREQSPLLVGWHEISTPFAQIFAADASFSQLVYWLVCALWSLVVWSFFGGAITRQAAVCIARQENLSWSQLAEFVRPRWTAYIVAPLFPMLGTFLAALFLALLGLLMRVGPGIFLVGILWPLVLLIGFLMAFLLIGLFFGWPLMWGAISAEGTDSFGALSHSYSYAYQRPLHYLFYAVVAAFVGVLGWYLVSLFVFWIIDLSNWGISWGSGVAQIQSIYGQETLDSYGGNAGASLIQFWNNCLRTLAFGFIFSYFWSASTLIYFLLRRLVDDTEMDEVFMPEEQELHGLPPLKTGPDGVPAAADDPEAGGSKASS